MDLPTLIYSPFLIVGLNEYYDIAIAIHLLKIYGRLVIFFFNIHSWYSCKIFSNSLRRLPLWAIFCDSFYKMVNDDFNPIFSIFLSISIWEFLSWIFDIFIDTPIFVSFYGSNNYLHILYSCCLVFLPVLSLFHVCVFFFSGVFKSCCSWDKHCLVAPLYFCFYQIYNILCHCLCVPFFFNWRVSFLNFRLEILLQ